MVKAARIVAARSGRCISKGVSDERTDDKGSIFFRYKKERPCISTAIRTEGLKGRWEDLGSRWEKNSIYTMHNKTSDARHGGFDPTRILPELVPKR